MTIQNLTIKKGKVIIGGFGVPSEVATVTSISEVDILPQEHKNIIKKLIITGINPDLTGIKMIGEDVGELPNLGSIELRDILEVSGNLFYVNNTNNWLEYFSAPEATKIVNTAFASCIVLKEINLENATEIGTTVFHNCVALRKLTLGGTSVTVDIDAFYGLDTEQVDLYLSEEEYEANKNDIITLKKWKD